MQLYIHAGGGGVDLEYQADILTFFIKIALRQMPKDLTDD